MILEGVNSLASERPSRRFGRTARSSEALILILFLKVKRLAEA